MDSQREVAKKLSMDDVATLVMALAHRRRRFIPHTLAREIADLVVQAALTQTIETGMFKFRSGWGGLRLALVGSPGPLAGGAPTQRAVVRYDEGSIVRELCGVGRRPSDYKPKAAVTGRAPLLVRHGTLLPDT